MNYRQVKFLFHEQNGEDKILGGIALCDGDSLVHVICGCCGAIIAPNEVEILEVYTWIDLSDLIMFG